MTAKNLKKLIEKIPDDYSILKEERNPYPYPYQEVSYNTVTKQSFKTISKRKEFIIR